jgi:hypothetical protein
VVTVVELQAPTEPHCSRGVQPGGIYVYVVHLPGVRGRACAGAASASYASCRSGSVYTSAVQKRVYFLILYLV